MQAFAVELAGKKGTVYFCSLACAEGDGFNVYDGGYVTEREYGTHERCGGCDVDLNDTRRAKIRYSARVEVA